MLFVYLTFLFFLLSPAEAMAWGPGTHLDISLEVLKHAALCLPAIKKLIEKYSDEFIYGSVSPDIIVGKKYAGAIYHCHNWSMGKLILEESKTDHERASAWGYLTHLAADTVAHNYFVPYYTIKSFPARTLGHPYWEMRYDIHVPESSWHALAHVIRHNYHPFDHLLERVLKKTLFSFSTNKKIFNSILILHKMKQLRFGLKTYARASRWALNHHEVQYFRHLVMEIVWGFLKNPEKARCLQTDPAGTRKLKYAQEMSLLLRKWRRSGKINEGSSNRFVEKVREKLRLSLFDSRATLPNLSEEFLHPR